MAVLLDNISHRLKINNKNIQVLINKDKCLDYNVYIFPGKVKYGDEAFVFTVNVPNGDLDFFIPLNGYSILNTQNASYNWIINWGDGITETKSGVSSSATTNWIQHNYLTSGIYKIVIKPVVNNYQWMKAWGFTTGTTGNANIATNKNKIISFDYVTNKGFMQFNTSYGNYYLGYLAVGTKITYPINEIQTVSEDNITNINSSFRNSQYYNCSNLIIPAIEVLPNSVTSISDSFRNSQYYDCTNLTTTTPEVLPNSVTSVGDNFRNYQYYSCINISTPAIEVLPNSVTSISNNFRHSQYLSCVKLTITTPEVFPNSITSIGNSFRYWQYMSCSNLTTSAVEVLPDNITTIGNSFRYGQYQICNNLLISNHVHIRMNEILNSGTNNYYNMFRYITTKSDVDTIPNYKDASGNIYPITNLTPAVRKYYCTNRIGIDGYDSLHENWK